jgi:hypothetical protein
MVQTRWGHLNRDTRSSRSVQALMLDGHHLVENRARFGAGLLFNFSGTGGMWRREAIVAAGGWQHDTLTEDLDLSYRAQLAGWKFVYREDVVSPSELPEEMEAFRAQQYRWAKGTVQTARKLLGACCARKDLTLRAARRGVLPHDAALRLPAAGAAERAAPARAVADARDRPADDAPRRPAAHAWRRRARSRPSTSWPSAPRAARAGAPCGACRCSSPSVPASRRTSRRPCGKASAAWRASSCARPSRASTRVATGPRRLPAGFETGLALLSFASVVQSIQTGHWFATPFAALFTIGYGYVALLIASEQAARRALVERPGDVS